MVTDILKTPSVQRLAGLLHARFGKNLEVRFVVDATSDEWVNPESLVSNGDLVIPISVNGTFLGLGRVLQVENLQPSTVKAISDVVRLVLEPALYHRYLQSRLEASLRPIAATGRKPAEGRAGILLISAKDAAIQSFAVAVHDKSDRWALLRHSDLEQGFDSIQSIQALGRATLLVPNILDLPLEQMTVLKQFVLNSDPAVHPLILLGSRISALELRNSELVDHDLLDLLAVQTAEIDRWPTNKILHDEALSMLLNLRPQAREVDFRQ